MDAANPLWLFFLLVLGVVLLPGMDMAYVLGSTLVGGRRSGLAATGGIVTGGVVHVTSGALGIVALLHAVPAAFNLMLAAGSCYLGWIGWGLLRSRGAALSPAAAQGSSFRSGLVTSLLNPKAYLFMFAVFPQFLRPGDGAARAVTLWLVLAVTQAAVYGAVVLAGDRARGWLAGGTRGSVLLLRAVGGVLLGMAALTLVQGWRAA